MRFGSVCSGIEAASVAFNPLGWKAQFLSEIEPFPCAVLAHHYPDVPNHGDMTKFKDWPDANIDVLCGGTPCQSFSVAGLRKGLDDPRGDLMLTFGAIADRYRPEWLVWENVPGVLSSNGGRDFGSFLGLLGVLGYGFAYRVLDAQYFGLAQRRKRVFVVAHLGDWRRAAAVLFERHSLSGHPAPSREAREGTADCSRDGFAPGGFGSYSEGTGTIRASGGAGSDILIPERARALTTSNQRIDAETETLLPVAFDTTQITSPANRSNPKPGDPCHSLAVGAHPPAIAFDARQSNVIQYGEKTGPLDTDAHTMGLLTQMRVRRLTPRECCRLQGFPDDYLDITFRGKPAADGPRYKALGNSWAVPNVRWIARRIDLVEELTARLAA